MDRVWKFVANSLDGFMDIYEWVFDTKHFMRAAWLIVGLNLAGLLWLFGISVLPSFVLGTAVLLGFYYIIQLRGMSRSSQNQQGPIRVRIAAIDSEIESLEQQRVKLQKINDEIENAPGLAHAKGYITVEHEAKWKLAELDRELAPKLKKRTRLNRKLDEILQKKGYRG